MHVEESGLVDQPAEKVFNYVADPVNFPKCSGATVEVRDLKQNTPDQLEEGDRFMPVHKFLGCRIEEHVEITAYEPNRRLSERSTGGPVPMELTMLFEKASSGATRINHSADLEPGGLFRLAGLLLERALKRQVRNDLQTLEDVLEAQG